MGTGTQDHVSRPTNVGGAWHDNPSRALHAGAQAFLSDEALVRRARARDDRAFEALVARYCARLYTLALRSLGNEAEASAALCEMVISAYRDLDSSSRANCTPGTWLYLHAFRAVFKRMSLPRGKYTVESYPPKL